MEIREINLEEISGVLKLIDQYDRPNSPWPSEDEINRIFLRLRLSGGCVIGAIENAELVGSCTVNLCQNFSWSGRPFAIIENVIVSKQHRNKGIGKALLGRAKAYAQTNNCYKVALLTGIKDERVLKFYQSAGFEGSKSGFQVRFNA